uniref:Transposase IS200-like domain-containing protein n=1 Tax=Trichuris muris TaxID=70415 RepID=A0A5S6QVC1_TRIMR
MNHVHLTVVCPRTDHIYPLTAAIPLNFTTYQTESAVLLKRRSAAEEGYIRAWRQLPVGCLLRHLRLSEPIVHQTFSYERYGHSRSLF